MTKKQWFKRLRRALSALSKEERETAAQYYAELFDDKKESGETEEDILAQFGLPESAAAGILSEREHSPAAPRPSAGGTVARWMGVLFLFVCIGIPVLAVLFALAASAIILSASGAVISLAGLADCVWFFIVLSKGTEIAALAHIGIGVATTGAGLLMIPCFALCAKGMFWLCKQSLLLTGRMFTGKRSA